MPKLNRGPRRDGGGSTAGEGVGEEVTARPKIAAHGGRCKHALGLRPIRIRAIVPRAMERRPEYDLPDDLSFTVRPVAVMRSPYRVHAGTPRQPSVGPAREGRIVVRHGLQNLLQDLAGFSHVWVLFWCNYSRGWNEQVVPPRDTRKRGLFATRAPHRPNPIGLSVLELLRIDRRVLHVGSHDLLDGTPILDIKPYVAAYDSLPHASAGWLATLPADAGPDHRLARGRAGGLSEERSAR